MLQRALARADLNSDLTGRASVFRATALFLRAPFLEVGETPGGPGLPRMAGPPPQEFLAQPVEAASRYGMDTELPPG